MLRAILTLSLAAISYLLAGCSDSGDNARPEGVPPGFIVWTEPLRDNLNAVVAGAVHIGADGCVTLTGTSDAIGEPAIWPFGTTFDGAVIRTTDGIEIRDGDPVLSSGGEVEYEIDYYLDNTTLSIDLDVVSECGEVVGDRILAFNPLGSIEVTTAD